MNKKTTKQEKIKSSYNKIYLGIWLHIDENENDVCNVLLFKSCFKAAAKRFFQWVGRTTTQMFFGNRLTNVVVPQSTSRGAITY